MLNSIFFDGRILVLLAVNYAIAASNIIYTICVKCYNHKPLIDVPSLS